MLFCLAVLIPVHAHAQISRLYETWRWVHFGTESGLPSLKVFGVYESGKGEVWANTAGGLACFDGFQWLPAVIPGMDLTVQHELNIASDTAGILVNYQHKLFSLRGSTVEVVPLEDEKGFIPTIAAWREPGGALVLQHDSVLYRMTAGGMSPLPLPQSSDHAVSFPHPILLNFILCTNGGLWLKAGHSLYRYVAGQWETAFRPPANFLKIHQIVENASGSGMAVLEPVAGDVRVFEWSAHGRLRELPNETGDLIQSIAVSPGGQSLVLYTSGELRLRQNGVWSWLQPLPPPVEKPRFLRFRRDGDLWAGGEKGLFLCRISQQRWTNWREATSSLSKPSLSNVITEIVRARDGTFWIGTRDGVQVRSADGRVRWIRELSGLRLGRVTAIGEDRSGRIWIGSGASFSGAFCWDGQRWTHYGAKEGLAAPRIHRIAKDRRGRLWFLGMKDGEITAGLANEPGAFVLDGERFIRWGRQEGLLDGRVYSFVEDSKAGYWFGTWSGLSRFRNGQWTYWQKGRGLRESRTWTMAVDTSDRVFFSHQYWGLGYIDRHDSIRYISNEEGLIGFPVEEVEVDQRGWLWVATGNGLVCWNGTDWTRLDSRSGLANDQLWPIVPLEREILIGTQGDGVSILQLNSLNPVPAIVRIGEPAIDDDDVSITWQPHAYWGDMPSILIDTRFRISGSAWSTWSTQHAITLKDLTPGTYRIDVQPKAPFGQKHARTASRIFEIPPPLFLRPAVAVPLALLLLLVLVMALTGWVRYRSYNRAIRDNEVRFRTQYKAFPVPTATFRKAVDGFVLTDCNDAAVALTKGRATEWVGKTTHEIYTDRPRRRGLLDACYESRTTIRKEYRFEHQVLPAPIDVDLTLAFVPPDLVLVHAEDITERKRNEQHLQESREQLRALANRLQSVREEERTTLSREIHDELGQLITGLKMDLSWLRRRTQEQGRGIPEAVSQRINQMNTMLDDAIHTVRKIAGQLRPAVLDDLGLVAAIEWQARDFAERTGIRCDIALGVDELQMDRERATEFFRIYQELLTNITRHAQASTVQITLTLDDGVLALEVRDNGKGIHPEEIRRPASLGILGMEERALRIRGTLSIARGEYNGTVARVQVPLNGGDGG